MTELEQRACDMRIDIVRMIAEAGSGHPGGSLSCTDILTALYFGGVMDHDPEQPKWEDRDRFVLAKGHAAPALYAALAHAGYFPREELKTLRKLGTRLQGHPDCNLCPGVEVSTGSLGQGLSIAAGMAAGRKLAGKPQRVFCLLGDGECEEGQVWEAMMFANQYHLDNLCVIIDWNGLQIDGLCKDVMCAEPIDEKVKAFGFDVVTVDGNDFDQLESAFDAFHKSTKPFCILMKTVKGKGVSFMENECGWHGKATNPEEYKTAMAELTAKLQELEA